MIGGSRKSRVIPAAALILALGAAGTGFAYWTSPGSGGSGSATTGGGSGATDPVSLSPAIPTDELYPGGQASVGLIVANPNPADVRIGSLVLDTSQGTNGFDVDEDHAGCALTTLAFTTQTNAGAGWSIPANGSLPITLTGALSMTSDAANACQGATFQIYLTATG